MRIFLDNIYGILIIKEENSTKRGQIEGLLSYIFDVKYIEKEHYKVLTSIVSLTSLKNTYINGLEKECKKLREKYKVKQGQYLHFTDIKKLLKL